MVKFLMKLVGVFLVLTGATVILAQYFQVEFGRESYWTHHGVGLLIGLSFFPRLTLLLSSIPFGGLFWWLGWVFIPRILVATLATLNYWEANPTLVIIAWLIAIGGEASEKTVIITRRPQSFRRTVRAGDVIDVTAERR